MTKILLILILSATILWCLAHFTPGAILGLAALFYLTDRQNGEVSAFCSVAACLGSVTSIMHLALS